jgi:ribonuclease J
MWNGAVIATVVVDRKGRLAVPPKISAPGLLDPETDVEFASEIVSAIEDGVAKAGRDATDERVEDSVRKAVRETIRERRDGRPVVDVHLVRV